MTEMEYKLAELDYADGEMLHPTQYLPFEKKLIAERLGRNKMLKEAVRMLKDGSIISPLAILERVLELEGGKK